MQPSAFLRKQWRGLRYLGLASARTQAQMFLWRNLFLFSVMWLVLWLIFFVTNIFCDLWIYSRYLAFASARSLAQIFLIRNLFIFSHTEKTKFPFPFKLNGIWSWGNFFLLILNQIKFHLVQNEKENCHNDHIQFNIKEKKSVILSVRKTNICELWVV